MNQPAKKTVAKKSVAKRSVASFPTTVRVEAVADVYADIGRHRLRAKRGDVFEVPVETVAQLLESGVVREI